MIMDHKLKLMVVDDSPLFRTWLIRSLSADDRFQIVGYAVNALDAQEKIPLLQPDMLTLDIEMPGMSGIEFLKQLLPVHPIPVILVSSLNLRVFDALEAGAVDFVRKPDEANGLSKEIFLSMLRSKLMVAAASHVHLPSFCSCRPSGRWYPQGFFFTSCQKYFPAETKDSSGCFP